MKSFKFCTGLLVSLGKGPLPLSVQELPLKPILGSPSSGSTVLFPECMSPWGAGGLHSGSAGTRLLWKSLRMWFSITCCTGNRTRERWVPMECGLQKHRPICTCPLGVELG